MYYWVHLYTEIMINHLINVIICLASHLTRRHPIYCANRRKLSSWIYAYEQPIISAVHSITHIYIYIHSFSDPQSRSQIGTRDYVCVPLITLICKPQNYAKLWSIIYITYIYYMRVYSKDISLNLSTWSFIYIALTIKTSTAPHIYHPLCDQSAA